MHRYFEDFEVGQVVRSDAILIDRDRIVSFALEFDPQPQHIDEAAARTSHFGELVASGWHIAAVSMSLFVRNFRMIEGGGQGLGVDKIVWSRPVRPGDRLVLESHVAAARLSKSRPGKGIITVHDTTLNEQGERVQLVCHSFLVPSSGGDERINVICND